MYIQPLTTNWMFNGSIIIGLVDLCFILVVTAFLLRQRWVEVLIFLCDGSSLMILFVCLVYSFFKFKFDLLFCYHGIALVYYTMIHGKHNQQSLFNLIGVEKAFDFVDHPFAVFCSLLY